MPNQPLVELATCQEALREALVRQTRVGARNVVLTTALRAALQALTVYGRHRGLCHAFSAARGADISKCDCGLEMARKTAREALEEKPV